MTSVSSKDNLSRFISISKIDSKGRLLIPKEVRSKASSEFLIFLKDGKIELVPINGGLAAKKSEKHKLPNSNKKIGGDIQ